MDIKIAGIGDELGPSKVLWIRESRIALEAFVVIDNVACGPAIGGIRMAPDVTVSEVARLARAMTLKNAAAGLPHGGGKAGIVGEPFLPAARKEQLIRAFAHAIRELTEYIPGPDMGMNEECMAWIQDEIGRVVGLPRVLGGIPSTKSAPRGLALQSLPRSPRPMRALTCVGPESPSRDSELSGRMPRVFSASVARG